MRKGILEKAAVLAVAAAVWTGVNTQALASFSLSDPANARAASATFSASGDILTIVLQNAWSGDTIDQAHVLTGVFFSGLSGLTPMTAKAFGTLWSAPMTSSSIPGGGTDVSGEWGYGEAGSLPPNTTAGFAASGAITGIGHAFGDNSPLNGVAGGLLSQGFGGAPDNSYDGLAQAGKYPLYQSTVEFTLSGFSGNDLNSIGDVTFAYGTSPDLSFVPETTTLIAGALLLLPFGASTVRVLRRNPLA